MLALFVSITAFTTYQVTKRTANVLSIDGIDIYTDCTPVSEYRVIGDVTSLGKVGFDNSYEAHRKHILKRVHDKYPTAQAVLIDGSNVCLKATVLEYK